MDNIIELSQRQAQTLNLLKSSLRFYSDNNTADKYSPAIDKEKALYQYMLDDVLNRNVEAA